MNITRDYAQASCLCGAGSGVQPSLAPRPRNQRYVKWPRSPAGCHCVLRTSGPGVFARYRGSASGPSRAPPTLASACARLRPLRVLRSSPQPAAPGCLWPPPEKGVLAWHVGA